MYGLSYQGSKNKICDFVINHIPPAKNFYDLFCGGSAISHAALLSGKFKQVIQNDLNPLAKIFSNALNNQIPENQLLINCTFSATNNAKKASERLFVPKKQYALYKQKQGLLF